jgi:hypothetical protein
MKGERKIRIEQKSIFLLLMYGTKDGSCISNIKPYCYKIKMPGKQARQKV